MAGDNSNMEFKIGIIGGGPAVGSFWCPVLMKNSRHVKLVALWSRRRSTVDGVLCSINRLSGNPMSDAVTTFFDVDDVIQSASEGTTSRGLEKLLQEVPLDGIIVVLPVSIQILVLNRIVDWMKAASCDPSTRCSFPHVLCVGCPTTVPSKLANFINSYNALYQVLETPPVWVIDDAFQYESAFSRVRCMIGDIGNLVGGHLEATMVPMMLRPGQEISNSTSVLYSSVISYTALLKSIFGKVKEVNCARDIDNSVYPHIVGERLSGTISFENQCVVTLNLSSSSLPAPAPASTVSLLQAPMSFGLSVWGSKGTLKARWDRNDSCYEVQRDLNHFEAPSHHPATGMANLLQMWLNCCVIGSKVRSKSEYLDDLATAMAIMESKGSNVIFRPGKKLDAAGNAIETEVMSSETVGSQVTEAATLVEAS